MTKRFLGNLLTRARNCMNLVYPKEACKAVLYWSIFLLRLQQVVTPLANWQHTFFSARRSPVVRFDWQRRLWFHVNSSWTTIIVDSDLFTNLPLFWSCALSSDPLRNVQDTLPKSSVNVGNCGHPENRKYHIFGIFTEKSWEKRRIYHIVTICVAKMRLFGYSFDTL